MNPSTVGSHTIGTINNLHGDDYGWCCDNGQNIHGDSTALSTNRCLLIRKNTVHCGDSAVKYNRTNFNTLCDEWVGEVVEKHEKNSPADVSEVCERFAYVGEYNYGNYYGQFQEIYEIDLPTDGIKTSDSTYTLILDPTKYSLDTLPCTDLKFTLKYSDGTEKEEMHKVPIFIKTDSVIDNEHYYSLDTIVCDSCDVVIMSGKSFKINTLDTLKNRNVYIYV
jgi:hypothetical protein